MLHLSAYCQAHDIQFTRGRPYKKDDNAHIEQKNWTHVRKLAGLRALRQSGRRTGRDRRLSNLVQAGLRRQQTQETMMLGL